MKRNVEKKGNGNVGGNVLQWNMQRMESLGKERVFVLSF